MSANWLKLQHAIMILTSKLGKHMAQLQQAGTIVSDLYQGSDMDS